MIRPLVAAALSAVVLIVPPPAQAAGCLAPPVDSPVVAPFDAPACPYCAGHRGITYAPGRGTPVRAVAAGTVTFSGLVADVRYVVVEHADGLLATYGRLDATTLELGDPVVAGAIVGRSGAELHFGLRDGPDHYLDPTPLLGELVVRPYLVPTDGSPGRPPPPPTLRCRG